MRETKFYFVRHGQTNRNSKGALPDGLDDPLNEEGKLQALAASKNIPVTIDVAVSSPLARAVETLSIIWKTLDSDIYMIEADNRLSEVDFGNLKGKTWDEVDMLYPGENIKEKYRTQKYNFDEGDSYDSVRKRIYSFITDMKAQYPGKSILVATHAGIIRCIYKTERNYSFPDAPDNASVHEFMF